MIRLLISPNILILSTLLIGILNLLTPFASKKDSLIRNFLLITVSIFFFCNVIIIDWLFLKGIRANFSFTIFANYSIGFHLEPLGLIFLNLLGFLWGCALLYTTKYLALNSISDSSRFLFFFNLSVLSGIFISFSANLFTMFTFYEILTLSTLPLIGHSGGNNVKIGLSKYLKILMISGLLLFLPAILVIYAKVNHGNFTNEGLIKNNFSKLQSVILLLMFIFGIAKAAIYPMHRWLPAAMVAHYPVSSLLHAVVVVKAGLFCIYKIFMYIFGIDYLHSLFNEFNWLIFFPIITIFYGSFKALESDNIKKIFAYSTINQLGLALLSACMFTHKAMGAAILHMVSHSFTKICLFYSMGSIYSLKKTNQIQDLSGMSQEFPKISFIALIAGMSLIGLPPFSGFISKFSIILAAAEQKQILVMLVVISSSIFSALYLLKLFGFIYKSPQAIDPKKIYLTEKTVPFSMLASLIICLSCVILFYFINIFIKNFLFYI